MLQLILRVGREWDEKQSDSQMQFLACVSSILVVFLLPL